MVGGRIKNLRKKRGYTLSELAKIVGTSISTISRIETNETNRIDTDLLFNIANALGVDVTFLMKPEEVIYEVSEDIEQIVPGSIIDVVVEDDEMDPEIPEGAIVKIRAMMPNEKLQVGSFYFIEFDNQRKFRMASYTEVDGLGFLPISMNERRISYDRDYVKTIGKVIAMKVIFEDSIEYEID